MAEEDHDSEGATAGRLSDEARREGGRELVMARAGRTISRGRPARELIARPRYVASAPVLPYTYEMNSESSLVAY